MIATFAELLFGPPASFDQGAKTMSATMPLYQGTKTIRATPMTRGEYNAFRGWDVPADEDPADAGYLVEYTDGGKPNVVGFDGYVSWSPVDVFERSYRPCGTHGERMAIELRELRDKFEKLTLFATEHNPVFAELGITEKALLVAQRDVMRSYITLLAARLAQG